MQAIAHARLHELGQLEELENFLEVAHRLPILPLVLNRELHAAAELCAERNAWA